MAVAGGVVRVEPGTVGLRTGGCALPGLKVHATVRTPTTVNRNTLAVVCGCFKVPVLPRRWRPLSAGKAWRAAEAS
jgi:hypothetical protein